MKIVAIALLALSLSTAASPTFAVDNSISALCRDGAPESYSRPGGFCDAVADNKTMLPQASGSGCGPGYVKTEGHCVLI